MKKKKNELKEGEEYKLTREEAPPETKKESYATLDIKETVKKKIAKLVIEQMELAEASQERKDFLELEEYCRKRYIMEDLETEWPWPGASKRRTGDTTIAVDRMMPRVNRALFYSGHIVSIKPVGDNSFDNAAKQERWLDDILREEVGLEEKFDKFLYDSIMLNFGVLKNPWERKEKPMEIKVTYNSAEELLREYPDAFVKYPGLVLKLTGYKDIKKLMEDYPDPQKGLPKGEKIYVTEQYREIDEGQRPSWVDPKNIYFPPGTKDENNSWFCAERLESVRRDELIEKKKSGFYENVSPLFEGEKKADPNKEYEVFEARLRYDINGDGLEEDIVAWVSRAGRSKGEDSALYLRGIKFPYSHGQSYWIIGRAFMARYGFYSGGLGAKLRSINTAEDRRTNQVQNAFDQAIVKAFKHIKTPNSPYNPLKHLFYPGATLPVLGENELTEFKMSEIPQSSFVLGADNRREIELITGMPHNLSGQPTPGDMEASGKKTAMLLAEGMESVASAVKYLSRSVKRIAFQTQVNYYDLGDEELLKRGMDKGYQGMTKKEIIEKAKMSLKPAIDSVSSQEKARMNLGLYKEVAGHPLFARNMNAQWVMLKSIISNWSEEWALIVDSLLSEDMKNFIQAQLDQAAKFAEEQAQAKAAAEEQAAAAGGGAPGQG